MSLSYKNSTFHFSSACFNAAHSAASGLPRSAPAITAPMAGVSGSTEKGAASASDSAIESFPFGSDHNHPVAEIQILPTMGDQHDGASRLQPRQPRQHGTRRCAV